MKIIGLTGGVGCGKSTVANILMKDYDAKVLFTDDIAKASYAKGEEGYRKIIETFGDDILDETGDIDRAKLGQIVFADEIKLKMLNSLIHPIVWDEVIKSIKELKKSSGLLVIESAILIEAGYKELCDEIWYVRSDDDVRINRLMQTRGYTKEKCESIINNQGNEKEYISNSDVIINNNSDILQLKNAISKSISGKE